ncbi:MAG TPA: hypothetical protein PKK11_07375, partial [Methanothrix sp.]|nr:hypothetical protein [Methanothrix sp.]
MQPTAITAANDVFTTEAQRTQSTHRERTDEMIIKREKLREGGRYARGQMRSKSIAASPGGEMEQISLKDLDEVDILLTELEVSQGHGNLILCFVASPAYRDRIVEAIKSRFPVQIQAVEKGDDLIHDLREI